MTHPYSPGSVFMLPHGTRIVHKLQEYLRSEYNRYGYQEVMTPLIYKKGLWETSGHWQNYMDDMYMVHGGQASNEEEGLFGLKPMNCPGHCLIFDSTPKSYRDLPIRLADFSPLHRYEIRCLAVLCRLLSSPKALTLKLTFIPSSETKRLALCLA